MRRRIGLVLQVEEAYWRQLDELLVGREVAAMEGGSDSLQVEVEQPRVKQSTKVIQTNNRFVACDSVAASGDIDEVESVLSVQIRGQPRDHVRNHEFPLLPHSQVLCAPEAVP